MDTMEKKARHGLKKQKEKIKRHYEFKTSLNIGSQSDYMGRVIKQFPLSGTISIYFPFSGDEDLQYFQTIKDKIEKLLTRQK